MSSVTSCGLPAGALLGQYLAGGAYVDCYVTAIARHVTHAEYVAAFYTTPVFKLERLILEWLVSLPSSDAQARELAVGTLDTFAAWSVESRCTDQLLLCDFRGRTRSWLMTAPVEHNGGPGTHLYFGSAVVPVTNRRSGKRALEFPYRALLGFHKLYARVLLRAARSRLIRARAP